MTDNTQTEALLPSRETLMAQAQVFASAWAIAGSSFDTGDGMEVAEQEKAILADMTRRLHARIAELEAQLESIGAGGVSGPLIGQPQAVPDLTALTERGAKAWTAVDAQALRDGVASVAASAPAPSGHIKEPYTVAEIKAKIASNDYSAELLLQHAMLHLDRLAASAVSEPVEFELPPTPFKSFAPGVEIGYDLFGGADIRLGGEFVYVHINYDCRYTHNSARMVLAEQIAGILSGSLVTHPSPPEGMVATDAMIEAGKKMLHNSNGRGAREKVERIFNAMIALAAPPTAQAEGWRPIETAPKDGKRILVHPAIEVADAWSKAHWSAQNECWIVGGSPSGVLHTAWHPLPPPPTSAEGVEHG